jgi:hypothetical protein
VRPGTLHTTHRWQIRDEGDHADRRHAHHNLDGVCRLVAAARGAALLGARLHDEQRRGGADHRQRPVRVRGGEVGEPPEAAGRHLGELALAEALERKEEGDEERHLHEGRDEALERVAVVVAEELLHALRRGGHELHVVGRLCRLDVLHAQLHLGVDVGEADAVALALDRDRQQRKAHAHGRHCDRGPPRQAGVVVHRVEQALRRRHEPPVVRLQRRQVDGRRGERVGELLRRVGRHGRHGIDERRGALAGWRRRGERRAGSRGIDGIQRRRGGGGSVICGGGLDLLLRRRSGWRTAAPERDVAC